MGEREFDHNRVLRDVARSVLRPLGLTQKGRSRTWLDDRVWHLIVVEFQPSAWSRGTYLNVDVTWLWNERPYLTLDFGPYRIGQFRSIDDGDWAETCATVATRAAAEVESLRSQLPSVTAAGWAMDVGSDSPSRVKSSMSMYNSAIAFGMSGDVVSAHRNIDAILAVVAKDDGMRGLQSRAADLRPEVVDTSAFRAQMIGRIQRSRELLKLAARTDSDIEASLPPVE